MVRKGWSIVLLIAWAAAAGCGSQTPKLAETRPPVVAVSLPVEKEVSDFEEFTGQVAAVYSVDIRARVSGYLEKVHFNDGDEVKENALLFEIDPRPFKAELERNNALLVQAEAHEKRLKADFQRVSSLYHRGAVGREEFDRCSGDYSEAEAAVGVAKANRDAAQLNLDYTKVRAKIGGRLSRRLVDPGNLVQADQTALTSIVTLDPLYIYFDVDERTMLRINRLIGEGMLASTENASVKVLAGLSDEEGYSLEGAVNFSDNRVDTNTGTLRVRGVFKNPTRLLSPGLFVRVRLPIGKPHPTLLVSEQALGTDQGKRFAYVVNDRDEVTYRPVEVGSTEAGLRVITGGLKPGERIVVGDLQRVRPGVKVEPKMFDGKAVASAAKPKKKAAGGPAAKMVPTVIVGTPVNKKVSDFEDFTGRVDAVYSVEIRARVSGHLEKVHFKDGDEVKHGDLLFEIDPRPYEAELERTRATLSQGYARLKRLKADKERATHLYERGAIGREEFDRVAGDYDEAEAAVGVAKANWELSQLNLEFTKVRSPIAGRLSRRLVDPGNLIQADTTSLTTVVSLDPIYVYFDVDERTMLRLRRLMAAGKLPSRQKGAVLPVMVGLSDEEGFPHQGRIDFSDNKLNVTSGTLQVRGSFDNPGHLITPGLFVRVRFPVGQPYEALLVSEQALGTDQGKKFLYVVNDQSEVVYRPVKVGLMTEGLRVITDGLVPGERFVLRGLQRVRPGIKVKVANASAPVRGDAASSKTGGSAQSPTAFVSRTGAAALGTARRPSE